jgi:hypothetical protein
LIVGDVVYVFTRIDDQEGMTALERLPAGSGGERAIPRHTRHPSPRQKHGASPKATPLYHDGRLFTLGISGIASPSTRRAASRLWQSAAPKEAPFYGRRYHRSRLRDLVDRAPGRLRTLDGLRRPQRRVKWTAGSWSFFASPILVTLERTQQVVSVTLDFVIGVSLDGRILWRFPFDARTARPRQSSTTTRSSSTRRRVIAFRPRLRTVRGSSETMWETKEVSTYLSTPVARRRVCTALDETARAVLCARREDGQVLWLGTPREATTRRW